MLFRSNKPHKGNATFDYKDRLRGTWVFYENQPRRQPFVRHRSFSFVLQFFSGSTPHWDMGGSRIGEKLSGSCDMLYYFAACRVLFPARPGRTQKASDRWRKPFAFLGLVPSKCKSLLLLDRAGCCQKASATPDVLRQGQGSGKEPSAVGFFTWRCIQPHAQPWWRLTVCSPEPRHRPLSVKLRPCS